MTMEFTDENIIKLLKALHLDEYEIYVPPTPPPPPIYWGRINGIRVRIDHLQANWRIAIEDDGFDLVIEHPDKDKVKEMMKDAIINLCEDFHV